MLRKFLYLYPFLLGYIKLLIYKIFYGSDLQFSGKIRFSYKASIRIRKGGKLVLKDNAGIADGCFIGVTSNGVLIFNERTNLSAGTIIVCQNSIEFKKNSSTGPLCCIFDHDHDYKTGGLILYDGFVSKPILVEENAWIGCHCTILKGVKIGTGSVVAAGSVVTKDVPPHTLYYSKGEKVYTPIKSEG